MVVIFHDHLLLKELVIYLLSQGRRPLTHSAYVATILIPPGTSVSDSFSRCQCTAASLLNAVVRSHGKGLLLSAM